MSDVTAGSSRLQTDLFQILRDGKARTRSELAGITGLARSTVAARIEALMELGLIGPIEDAVSTGGRPSSQFAISGSNRIVAGADIGASHVRVALSSLTGEIQGELKETIPIDRGPEEVLGWVVSGLEKLLAESGRSESDLLAIGVGLPGPVEHRSGRPINPPIMPGWDKFDVPGWIGRSFSVPVLVDNDVNIMALGERHVAWPGVDQLIFVKVATGIGAGIISGGVLQRGAQGTAGDIGHIAVTRGEDIPCQCGNRGCLEALASGPAIARVLRSDNAIEAETSNDVVGLVKQGNLQAIQAVRQAGRDIGEVLTTCVSLMNPQVIVIGGSIAQAGEHIIAGAREVVYARSMPLATESLHIVQSRTGADAAIVGAALLALDHALSYVNVEKMILENEPKLARA
ncbi:putative NBD/HSP70 family sugar kinase [Microbacteriaceae bacterium SG_E_30_P1]|uniref:NBD/HSP70 family sugar kinase n=1 Tax=Antiquaquibacter oligotrophicus TaxID=2880260 RepID=A0ABT6KPI9_9MICO|nr:ROK family transcriptional regulator [Antiquaquibacter oligotrophicus]MDH6181911.1 putative NBD/HSP70 family sugar kinase [Antiquaquibacter oligotrophicus]UDF12417.1 ROK family transcriptional regulator [Antiquaquibacter oligotrophicus]